MMFVSRITNPPHMTSGKVYEGQMFLTAVPASPANPKGGTEVTACIYGDDSKWLFVNINNVFPMSAILAPQYIHPEDDPNHPKNLAKAAGETKVLSLTPEEK